MFELTTHFSESDTGILPSLLISTTDKIHNRDATKLKIVEELVAITKYTRVIRSQIETYRFSQIGGAQSTIHNDRCSTECYQVTGRWRLNSVLVSRKIHSFENTISTDKFGLFLFGNFYTRLPIEN